MYNKEFAFVDSTALHIKSAHNVANTIILLIASLNESHRRPDHYPSSSHISSSNSKFHDLKNSDHISPSLPLPKAKMSLTQSIFHPDNTNNNEVEVQYNNYNIKKGNLISTKPVGASFSNSSINSMNGTWTCEPDFSNFSLEITFKPHRTTQIQSNDSQNHFVNLKNAMLFRNPFWLSMPQTVRDKIEKPQMAYSPPTTSKVNNRTTDDLSTTEEVKFSLFFYELEEEIVEDDFENDLALSLLKGIHTIPPSSSSLGRKSTSFLCEVTRLSACSISFNRCLKSLLHSLPTHLLSSQPLGYSFLPDSSTVGVIRKIETKNEDNLIKEMRKKQLEMALQGMESVKDLLPPPPLPSLLLM